MRSNASFRKDAGSSAPTKGVVCLRCHLHRKVRDIRVIVMVDIMVMVRGQIFSREVVITSLLSKGIPYGSVRLEVHTNMGSTVGLVRGRTVVGRWSKVVAKGHLIVGKAGCCVTEHDPVIPAKSTDMADVNVGSCHGSCKCH